MAPRAFMMPSILAENIPHQSGNDLRTVPFCLACGYERTGLDHGDRCPECGHDRSPKADESAHRGALATFNQPLRRAMRESVGRVPLGWWCLIPPTARLRGRLQLVASLSGTTALLLMLFLGGAHIRLWRPSPSVRGIPTGGLTLVENVVLGGIVRGDLGVARELGTRPLPRRDYEANGRSVELVTPNWSPFLFSIGIWSACLPAAGLLGLRFVLVPFVLRCQRRSLSGATRDAARIAADATVASAAIGCTAVVVGFAVASFLVAMVAPPALGALLARAAPATILSLLLLLPPLLVAIVIWNDRARRVFAWPRLAAAMTFASYFLGIGMAIGAISATFAIAVRVLS